MSADGQILVNKGQNGEAGRPLFEIRNLCKSFGETEVLKNISTTISQGEVVVIVGPSGSGKSTFLRSLNLLEEPTSGQILFEGKDITDPGTNINKYRQHIGNRYLIKIALRNRQQCVGGVLRHKPARPLQLREKAAGTQNRPG